MIAPFFFGCILLFICLLAYAAVEDDQGQPAPQNLHLKAGKCPSCGAEVTPWQARCSACKRELRQHQPEQEAAR